MAHRSCCLLGSRQRKVGRPALGWKAIIRHHVSKAIATDASFLHSHLSKYQEQPSKEEFVMQRLSGLPFEHNGIRVVGPCIQHRGHTYAQGNMKDKIAYGLPMQAGHHSKEPVAAFVSINSNAIEARKSTSTCLVEASADEKFVAEAMLLLQHGRCGKTSL
jgi:hypothetical protein